MLFRNDKKDNRDNAPAQVVPLLPLRELIVFPHEVYPIFVGRQKSIKALEEAEKRTWAPETMTFWNFVATAKRGICPMARCKEVRSEEE